MAFCSSVCFDVMYS